MRDDGDLALDAERARQDRDQVPSREVSRDERCRQQRDAEAAQRPPQDEVRIVGVRDARDRATLSTCRPMRLRLATRIESDEAAVIGARSRPTAMSHEPLRQLEAAVRRSGLAWTILEPGGFASNARAWIQSVRTEATVAAPFADVAVPIVDPDDIAAVAATALRDDRHAGALNALTGPVAISPREQCAELGGALGKTLRFVELTRAQAAAAWRAFMPPTVVETTLDALGAPNELESTVSPDVERVLGRKPRPFSAWATRNASMFGG